MEQEVNKSGELSIEELIKELRPLDYMILSKSLSKLSVEQKLDLVDSLNNKEDNILFWHIFENLLSSYDNWLLNIYLSTVFPWEKISEMHFNETIGNNFIFVETDERKELINFKDISIPELRKLNNQLLCVWVDKTDVFRNEIFKKITSLLLETWEYMKWESELTVDIDMVIQRINEAIKLKQELEKLYPLKPPYF